MAKFFPNPSQPLHQAIDCLYWLYPYNDQVLVDRAVLASFLGSARGGTFFKLLKFFPVAFMLTWERGGAVPPPLLNLGDYRATPIGTEANVVIDVTPPPHQLWPEVPTEHSAVMYAGHPRVAQARKPKAKAPRGK